MITPEQLREIIASHDELKALAEKGDMVELPKAIRPYLPRVPRTEPFMVTELILDLLYGFERACGILQTMDAIATGTEFDQIPESIRYRIGRLKRLLETKEIDAIFGGSTDQLAGLVALGILTQDEAAAWASLGMREADPLSGERLAVALRPVESEGK
jgi:hypothetical protein